MSMSMSRSALLFSVLVAAVSILVAVVRSYLHSKLYTQLPSAAYDFVIVGGGTAGSLVAAELAARHPDRTVLLLEAGLGVRDNPLSEQSMPGGALYNVAFGNVDWGYKVESQRTPIETEGIPEGYFYEDRSFPIPRGRGLGGSNELNFMLHVRGTTKDYEVWEAMTGEPRWGPASMRSAEDEYEATVAFAPQPRPHPLARDWVAAAASSPYDALRGSYNAPGARRHGGHHFEHAVRDGVRQSTARQFLLPRLGRDNLHVAVGARVARVLLGAPDGARGPRAEGVALSLGPCRVPAFSVPVLGTLVPEMPCLFGGRGGADAGRTIEVAARAEVILSAGAYETPHLLLKSGIGPKDELQAAGVRALVDVPGVGKNLQDHPMVTMKYRLGKEGGAWFPKSAGKLSLGMPSVIADYFLRGRGLLASSGCDFGYFGASSPEYEGRPDLQVHGMVTAGDADFFTKFLRLPRALMRDVGAPSDYGIFAQGLGIAPTLLHAKARGEVRLRPKGPPHDGASSRDVDHPVIEYEAFHEDEDVARLIGLVRRVERLMAQPALARHGPTLLHARALAARFGAGTDAYWGEYMKRFGCVVYHPAGTCRMGRADDPTAVVDPELRVVGVRGLRVADASVMPEITSGNTQVPTAAIGVQLVRILGEAYGPARVAV